MVIGFDARRRSDEFAHDHRGGARRRRVRRPGAAARAADAGAVLRRPPPGLRRRGDGDRQPQPAATTTATRSTSATARSSCRRPTGRSRRRSPPSARPGRCRVSDEWLTLGDDVEADYVAAVVRGRSSPSRVPAARRADASPTPRCTGSGPTRRGRCSPPPGCAEPVTVAEQDRPDPAVPDRRLPEPGGAGRDRPAEGRSPRGSVPTSRSPRTRTPTGAAVVCDGRQLTGDEVGALLADWLLRRGVRGTYASSLVSGSLMHVVAAAARACRRRRRRPGSSGSSGPGRPRRRWCSATRRRSVTRCRPSVARDKDGISAALAVALLAAELKATGRTLLDRLDELAPEHGLFVTGQLSVRVEDLSLISDAMARLRAGPPARLLGRRGGVRRPGAGGPAGRRACGCSATACG